MKKRRNDAWDAALTEAQRWEAYEKAKGASWTAFADWCAAEFGVRPGKNAIHLRLDGVDAPAGGRAPA